MAKFRLDVLVFNRGLVESRAKAQALIMNGAVYVDGQKSDKPGKLVSEDSLLEIRCDVKRFVSRGGISLEGALNDFGICVRDKVALDSGASTGGFTDCLLRSGARKVYAVDVGYGQLAWEIRNDPRVIVMERTNVRYLKRKQIGEPIDICTLDLSFISLEKVWPTVKELLTPKGEILSLVKPQFEAGKSLVGKRGVVRDMAVHISVLSNAVTKASECGFALIGLSVSPIRGPEGNIEFWLYARKADDANINGNDNYGNVLRDIPGFVDASHAGMSPVIRCK